jgi:hypothetical protein
MKFKFKHNGQFIAIYEIKGKSFWFGIEAEYIGMCRTLEEADKLIEQYKEAKENIKQLESKYGQ